MYEKEFHSIAESMLKEMIEERMRDLAVFLKTFYDSLVDAGFSESQAMELVVNYHTALLELNILQDGEEEY